MGTIRSMTEGIQITQEQARELEQKSQDVWHWKEVDLREWATKRVSTLFKGRQLVDTPECSVHIHKTEVYGEAFATSRKGHTEATCNLDCRVYWRGQFMFNGATVASAEGTIKFPEVVASAPAEEWPIKILTDGEDPSAMRYLNPCGSLEETQLRPLETYERQLREEVEKQEDALRGLMAKMVQDMRAHAAGEVVTETSEDKDVKPSAEQDEKISEKVRKEVEEKMESMRVEALPEKFQKAMSLIAAGEAPERMELSVSRITDTEVKELVSALKGDTQVKHLNLSFNQITDVGIQTLVTGLATGAAKGLKELLINNNKYGEMGSRMLGGVGMMRKGLKVTAESALDNVHG